MNARPSLFSAGPWGQPPPPPPPPSNSSPPPSPPQPLPINLNFLLQSSLNLYTYLSNLAASFTPHCRPTPPFNNFPVQNPWFPPNHFSQFHPPNNFPIQNPSFAPNHFSNSVFHPPPQPPPQNPTQRPERIDRFAPNHFSISEIHPPPQPPPLNPKQRLERIDRAVETARSDLIAAGEGVSAWKVTQSAIRILEVNSWSDLGFSMQQVPSLHHLMLTEAKINAFIHCFVGVRRIASLYDLELAICKNEGIEQFKELRLGPLLRNPLVMHYFSVKRDATEVFKITSEDIISLLSEFMDTCKHTYIRVEEFLEFIVYKCTVASREDLGIRIHSLGMHISAIRVSRDLESAALKKSGEFIIHKPDSRCTMGPLRMQQDKHFTTSIRKQFCGKHIRFDSDDDGSDDENNDNVRCNQVNILSQSAGISDKADSEGGLVVSPSQSKGPLSQVKLSPQSAGSSDRVNSDDGMVVSPSQSKGQPPSLKMQQDEDFSTISCRVGSSFSILNQFCGKHIRFDSAENSENEGSDDDLDDGEDFNSDQVTCSLVNFPSQFRGRSGHVSSCPYPSAMEEIQRLGLDLLSPDSGSQKHKETNDSVKKKRKSENLALAIYVPPKSSCSQKHKETSDSVKKKRKSENLALAIYVPPKLRKTEMVEQVAPPLQNGRQANNVRNLDGNKMESWPLVDWRTAPRYDYARANGFRTQAPIVQFRSDFQMKRDDNYDRFVKRADMMVPVTYTSNFGKRDRLSTCTPDAIQAEETGRLGEVAAYKYFIDKFGKSAVKWVNEHRETRFPYDIIVDNEGSREFIEVKATRNPTKDWFEMSVRQLLFAVEQGEAFSIAHVIVSDNDAATVRVYKNMEKLLMKRNNQEVQDQDCKLRSVVMVLEPQKEFTIVSCNSL